MVWKDTLKGGRGDEKKPSDFSADSIKQGQKVEKEHSPDKHLQTEIALDHLTEDKDYYKKLDIMESAPLSRLQKLRKCMKKPQ